MEAMLNPDFLSPVVWVPLVVVLWALFLAPLVSAVLRAPTDPDPELSRLDRMDGLDSRTG